MPPQTKWLKPKCKLSPEATATSEETPAKSELRLEILGSVAGSSLRFVGLVNVLGRETQRAVKHKVQYSLTWRDTGAMRWQGVGVCGGVVG